MSIIEKAERHRIGAAFEVRMLSLLADLSAERNASQGCLVQKLVLSWELSGS